MPFHKMTANAQVTFGYDLWGIRNLPLVLVRWPWYKELLTLAEMLQFSFIFAPRFPHRKHGGSGSGKRSNMLKPAPSSSSRWFY